MEEKCAADRLISGLWLADGTVINATADLLEAFSSFFSTLFSAQPCDPQAQSELFSHVLSSLSAKEASSCEGDLSLEECFAALSGMARRKAPGSDGLPMEFYLKFWHVLDHDLVLVLNSCLREGHLSLSQRRGVISLSFKKGDRLDPKNWRPISLLNCDYKIASRVIAGRLLKVIHLVVGKDQTCGVPGRFIGENVAFLRDVVDFATLSNVPVALLSLDQEKAFDRFDWDFMCATLRHMGFGPSSVGWVDLFYSGVQSAVNVNGHISDFFALSRGVRQGCPLSPLLYVLVTEVLAATSGQTRMFLVCLFLAFNRSCHASLSMLMIPRLQPLPIKPLCVFETYDLYEKGLGSKLNLSKSKGLWLGPWNGRSNSPVAIDWSSVKIKVLGVFLGPLSLEEENWRPRLSAVENVLLSWRQRALSLKGKALVINALALSRIWYVASLIHLPPWVLQELNFFIFNLFWKGKPDLVSRAVVVQPNCCGGFSVVDVKLKVSALLLQWIRRFVNSPNSWVSLLVYWFNLRLGLSPSQVFANPPEFDVNLPAFYTSLLRAWRLAAGSASPSGGLYVGSGIVCLPISGITTKSAYLMLLADHTVTPHCEVKFFPVFGLLHWSSTWRQLFLFSIDRTVIDLSWKIAHGVLYTAQRLSSFGYGLSTNCFCGHSMESLDHLFFYCPLATSVLLWLQSLLFRAAPLAPPFVCRHALFGFSEDELCVMPLFFVYALNVCKFYIWMAHNNFRFRDTPPSAIDVIESVKSRITFHLPLFFRRFRSPRQRRYFLCQWGACGTIASVSNGTLSVHF